MQGAVWHHSTGDCCETTGRFVPGAVCHHSTVDYCESTGRFEQEAVFSLQLWALQSAWQPIHMQPLYFWCWASVVDGGPTSIIQWNNILCLLIHQGMQPSATSKVNLPLLPYKYQTTAAHSQQKWNESGFRPLLCTYRLNWARRTSWGWWDDWDDTVLQTQDSKFEPWRSEAEHATSRSRRLPTILTFTRGWAQSADSTVLLEKQTDRILLK